MRQGVPRSQRSSITITITIIYLKSHRNTNKTLAKGYWVTDDKRLKQNKKMAEDVKIFTMVNEMNKI